MIDFIFAPIMAAIGFTTLMLIRNNSVHNARMKAINLVHKYNINIINENNHSLREVMELTEKTRGLLFEFSYEYMILNLLIWDFDKLLNIDNKIKEISNEQ